MARPKKPVAKKATKKPAAKAASTKAKTARGKKPAVKKSANAKAKKANQTQELQLPSSSQKSIIRRPDPNLPPSPRLIDEITHDLLTIIELVEEYAANLRSLDRMRHNGVGMKRLGFIEAAFRISTNFPQYFPHWLNTPKFKADIDLFNSIRSLVEACRSLEEKAWNINVESADMIYTDALEYYSQVQDAANRRIDSAESLYTELHGFFRRDSMEKDEPTEKQLKRDVNALRKGKKDGEVTIKNISPKTTGGKREITDETFKSKASFKDMDEGSIED
jgi:hypothetical protein